MCDILEVTEVFLQDQLPTAFGNARGFATILDDRGDMYDWLDGEDLTQGTKDRIDALTDKKKRTVAEDEWLTAARNAETDILVEMTEAHIANAQTAELPVVD